MSQQPTGSFARTATGCLVLLLVFVVLSVACDRWTATRVDPALRPWLGIAAGLQFTLALGALWTALAALRNPSGSRRAILARAAEGTVPDEDGVAVVTGTVRAASFPLQAPLSGTPCVAYAYKMFREVRGPKGRPRQAPVYWGLASRAFIVDTRMRAVRVMAVPWLLDAPARLEGEAALTRARRHVSATAFQEFAGGLGAIGTAIGAVRVIFQDDDGEHRADFRARGDTSDPSTLVLEETVLPVGAAASVAGTWSAARAALVPAGTTGPSVTATTGPVTTLLRQGGLVPASGTGTLVYAVVLAALGVVLLWAASTWLGPGSPYVPR